MKGSFTLSVLICLVLVSATAASSTEELLGLIRKNRIDAKSIYQVRDLTLQREDMRIYFTDGILALFEPMGGSQITGALFVGDGELLVMPPNTAEKRNLARFIGTPVLNEKFSSAYLRFTDDTATRLLEGLRGGAERRKIEGAEGTEIIEQWGPVTQNLNLMHDLRVLADLLNTNPPGPGRPSFFAARLFGQRLGAFDISLDSRAQEPLVAGQSNWKEGRRYTDLWLSASIPSGTHASNEAARPVSYRIETSILSGHELQVSAEVQLEAQSSGDRLITFELSRFLRVSAVETEGRAIPYYQNETLGQVREESQIRRRANDLISVVLPAALEKGRRYLVKFRYSGEVISDAGHGVLYVGARGIWYPNRGFYPADYDLTFRIPRRLSLVATGNRVEQKEEGEWRISRWKSKQPLRVAGFNVGDYEEAEAKAADGTVLEVYANRNLETALEARRPVTVIPPPPLPPGVRQPGLSAEVTAPVPPPSPSMVAARMARDAAQVLDFFTRSFGPLPFGHIAISPVPGNFGQGWPGLVYLSTMSYLLPYDSVRRPMSQATELYYRELLLQHELAHQWWGHVVTTESYRDEWLTEALSSYSALLWLEQRSRTGAREVRLLLDQHRKDLLVKNDDEIAESAGPLALGFRLSSSKTPHGAEVIFYKKGPWVIHMLRSLMRDTKSGSDAAFFKFLRTLRDEFSARPLTTEGFRALAEKFVTPELNAESGRTLEWFFDQWVYGTGIPELKVTAKVEKPRATAKQHVTGTAALEGVDESWILPVPIYVQTARGEVFAGIAVAGVGTSAEESKYSVTVTGIVQRAVVDPQQSLLTQKN